MIAVDSQDWRTTMDNERLNYLELAKKLRVKPPTIRSWQLQGMPYIPCGHLRFYNLAAVEQWLRERDNAKQAAKKEQVAA
jgi:phage terminase Nu1 subunit (DNA packaging protein)